MSELHMYPSLKMLSRIYGEASADSYASHAIKAHETRRNWALLISLVSAVASFALFSPIFFGSVLPPPMFCTAEGLAFATLVPFVAACIYHYKRSQDSRLMTISEFEKYSAQEKEYLYQHDKYFQEHGVLSKKAQGIKEKLSEMNENWDWFTLEDFKEKGVPQIIPSALRMDYWNQAERELVKQMAHDARQLRAEERALDAEEARDKAYRESPVGQAVQAYWDEAMEEREDIDQAIAESGVHRRSRDEEIQRPQSPVEEASQEAQHAEEECLESQNLTHGIDHLAPQIGMPNQNVVRDEERRDSETYGLRQPLPNENRELDKEVVSATAQQSHDEAIDILSQLIPRMPRGLLS